MHKEKHALSEELQSDLGNVLVGSFGQCNDGVGFLSCLKLDNRS